MLGSSPFLKFLCPVEYLILLNPFESLVARLSDLQDKCSKLRCTVSDLEDGIKELQRSFNLFMDQELLRSEEAKRRSEQAQKRLSEGPSDLTREIESSVVTVYKLSDVDAVIASKVDNYRIYMATCFSIEDVGRVAAGAKY